jgi:hypothetical protein
VIEFDPQQFSSPATNWIRQKMREREDEHSRTQGKPPLSDYELEGLCFKSCPVGMERGSNRAEFCMNLIRWQWGEFIQLESGVYQNTFAHRVIRATCKSKLVHLMGCAGSGKSTLAAAYVATCWKFSPWNTSAFISTTTAAAGQARSWGIAKDLHRNDRFKVGKLVEYLTLITMEDGGGTENRDYRDAIKAVLVPKGGGTESENAIAAIVGQHNTNVLWLVDEFPFMPIGILTGRLNVMANPFWQFIGLGNMPKEGDPMYQDAEPVNGWDSINPDVATGWETRSGGWCEYLDGEKSPNLDVPHGTKPPFKGIMSQAMLDDIARSSGGTDTPGYWNQARGFPKRGIAHDTVLTRELLVQYKACEKPVWSGDRTTSLAGLDLGFREDGDPCVLQFSKLGTELDGRMINCLDPETVRLFVKVGSSNPFEQQIANQCLEELMKRNCHHLELDISGEGGIISQRIAERARELNYPLTIYPTSFAGSPDENVRFRQGEKMVEAKELFDRKVTQLWMSFRLCVQNGRIRGMSLESRSTRQLRMRRVIQDEKKRMSIETKKMMKKRLKHSPDDGDAAVLNVSLALKLGLPNEPHDPRSDAKPHQEQQKTPVERAPRYSAHSTKSRYADNIHR